MSINCNNGLQTLQLCINGNKKCASICIQRARTRGFTKQSSTIDNANKNAVYEIGEILDFIYFYSIIKQFND
jgi:hypothetical protein